jgi:hypothetical protein
MERDLPCIYEELRSIVLESIGSANQIAGLYPKVAQIGANRFPAPVQPTGQYGTSVIVTYGGDSSGLSYKDKGRVLSIFWDLIIEGIIRPGLADGVNDKYPFYHVTERGQQMIAEGSASPYDPDGYLKRLMADVPNLDPVVLTYLTEALSTFRIGCLLSSTISLGCASEKLLLLLIDAYASALPSDRQTKFRKEVDGRMIKRQFDDFCKHLESAIKPKLLADLKDDLDVHVLGVFTLIRNMRNDAGHPTGKVIDRQQANANLILFPVYARHVYRLIVWLGNASF